MDAARSVPERCHGGIYSSHKADEYIQANLEKELLANPKIGYFLWVTGKPTKIQLIYGFTDDNTPCVPSQNYVNSCCLNHTAKGLNKINA